MGLTGIETATVRSPAGPIAISRGVASAVFREHRVVVALAVPYVAIGGALLAYLGQPWPFRLTTMGFSAIWLGGTACWFAGAWLQSPKRLRACLLPQRFFGAVFVALAAVPIQITFQSLKQAIGIRLSFPWDGRLDRWDRALHGGVAWRWFAPIIADNTAIRAVDLLYFAWFALVVAMLVWAAWTPHRALRQRALIAMLLLWIFAGTIGAALTASAGPCYVDVPEYRELLRRLDDHAPPLLARINQQGIWSLYAQRIWGPLAGISAMPSIHVGFALLAACIAWARARWVGAIGALYAIAIQIGSVALGWHYAIDGYAGAVCGAACWQLAGWLSGATGGGRHRIRSVTSMKR